MLNITDKKIEKEALKRYNAFIEDFDKGGYEGFIECWKYIKENLAKFDFWYYTDNNEFPKLEFITDNEYISDKILIKCKDADFENAGFYRCIWDDSNKVWVYTFEIGRRNRNRY